MGDSVKTGLATAAKVGAAAVAVASAAVVNLTKSAVDGYAEYEQLVGGVETLFKDSAGLVQGYAESAYKTAGISANEYMETVTSFSASLLQSLGGDTEKAAQIGDMAITDMADNANKMGTSMESIQNAYQGFAKQNYTMLDNLKLGYGGTKSEMERLLADAEKFSGVKYDISSLSDVYEAIHVVQSELGITGTTAKEAASTISGSFGTLKSAWENLVTGFANPDANLGELIQNVVDSGSTALNNLLPTITTAISGIAIAVEQIAPIISAELPGLVDTVLPSLLNAATALVNGLLQALPSILQAVVDVAPKIINDIISTALGMLPQIIDLGLQLVLALAFGLSDSLPELIPTIVSVILQIIDVLTNPDNVSKLLYAGFEILGAIIEGLLNAIPELVKKVPLIVLNIDETLLRMIPDLVVCATKLIAEFALGIVTAIPKVVTAAIELFNSFKDEIGKRVEQAKEWGKDLIQNFVDGIKAKFSALKDAVTNVAQTVKDFLGFSEPKEGPLSNFHTYAPDMMNLFAQGIRENTKVVTDQIDKSFDFGERTIGFGTSAVGASSSALLNAISGENNAPINLEVNLNLPDGTKLARFLLPSIVDLARANGTPIVNPA